MAEYPNLELLEYIFRHAVDADMYANEVDAFVFPQTWPNTGCGFAAPGCCYGQAFTKEYTTVLLNERMNLAMVAFGNKPAYIVENPNQEFVDDFNRKNMATKYEAKKRYKQEEFE